MSITTTLSFRRNAFAAPPPVAGQFIASKTGKSVLAVTKVTLFRRSGEPVARDTIRMQVDRMRLEAMPDGCEVLPWPIVAKVPVTLPVPAAVRFRELAAKVATPAATRSRKQTKRDASRTLRARIEDLESPVPAAQRHAVLDQSGAVFSPPKVSTGSWTDPDDSSPNRRSRKLSHGFRPVDPIVILRRQNPSVESGHVIAADCYRLCWERGPGGAMASGRDLTFTDRQFSSGNGPTEARCSAMTQWLWVQAHFLPRAQAALESVILSRTAVSTWAAQQRGDRRYWVGYIVALLDQLLVIYADDVDTLLRTEHISTD